MLKVIVFLYQYYLKIDKSENLAYLRVLVWLFAIFGLLQICIFNLFNIEIPYIDRKIITGTKLEGTFATLLISLPFFALFSCIYPPKKLKFYKDKFTYSMNYIWYLRVGFILYILVLMIIGLLNHRIKNSNNKNLDISILNNPLALNDSVKIKIENNTDKNYLLYFKRTKFDYFPNSKNVLIAQINSDDKPVKIELTSDPLYILNEDGTYDEDDIKEMNKFRILALQNLIK